MAASGCTGGSEQAMTDVAGKADPTMSGYLEEYSSGLEHHWAGKGNFENATMYWDSGEYGLSIPYYDAAGREYSQARAGYDNMKRYTNNTTEIMFASNLSDCAQCLGTASGCFLDAAEKMRSGNVTGSELSYLMGQRLIDESDTYLNNSIELMPEWLQ